MEITTEKIGRVTVVTLPAGRLAGSRAQDFKRQIVPVMEANDRLAIDITGVDYMDSSGFGAILVCRHGMKDKGGDLKVFGASEPVKQLFRLTKLDEVIDLLDTKEEALAALGEATD